MADVEEGSQAARYAEENIKQLKLILNQIVQRDLTETPSVLESQQEEVQLVNLQRIVGLYSLFDSISSHLSIPYRGIYFTVFVHL